ncbi:MAG: DUF2339 domain-containing protein [Chromatiales bacterium]|jgi:uncharacterized membrane protein
MQWIFILIGLFLGAGMLETFTGAIVGGLVGLVLTQAIRLNQLSRDIAGLKKQLTEFAERFERGTHGIYQRIRAIERAQEQTAPTPESASEAAAVKAQDVRDTPPATKAPASARQVAEPPAEELTLDLPSDFEESAPRPEPRPEPERKSRYEAGPAPVQSAAPDQGEREQTPVEPPTAREPSLLERGIIVARNWLLGGNTLVRVGVVLLFLGLAFLLRYAAERVVVPIELRYAGVAASAIGLLLLGWWLRRRNPNYALILQGTGVGVLYLTVFAAMRLHPLLEPQMAFVLLLLVTLCSAVLAVMQDALGLAAAAALGGFAAPILTSTGSGDHVALFSYFTLLNAGILAIAWFKAWRLLNMIGFVGTFGIGFAWGLRSYAPELFWSTEPFLVSFFLMYVAIGLLFARRRLQVAQHAPQARAELLHWSARQTDYVDATALFGPPLVGFGLQYVVIQHLEFGPAFSALGLGLFYLLLARLLKQRTGNRALLLVEVCLSLGVVFGTLAIPLGLDARWTSAAWAVEGAGIYWIGLRQGRTLARVFALLLQLAAAWSYLGDLSPGQGSLLDGAPLGALLLGTALLFSYAQLRRVSEAVVTDWEWNGSPLLILGGLLFLYLIAPLLFLAEGTAISWALAGLVTLYAGLRLQSRTFLFSAFAIQLFGGAVFLLHLDRGSGDAGVLASGWRGLMLSSLIGLALIAGMVIAARDRLVRDNLSLQRGLSLVLLAGLVFVNLSVLFVLPWRLAGAVWGGSGLLIVWLALQLQNRLSFAFGLLLQLVAGGSFLLARPFGAGWLDGSGLTPLGHAGFWTPAVLALAALLGAWLLERELRREPPRELASHLTPLAQLLPVWAAAWWAFAAVGEILRFVPSPWLTAALLLAAAGTVVLWSWLAQRLQWRMLALLSLLLTPAGLLILLDAWHGHYHPFADLGWLGWSALAGVHLLSLWRLDPLLPARPRSAAHVLGCWLILGVLALELRYLLLQLSEHYNAWRWLGWALIPSSYLLLVSRLPNPPWPIAAYGREYRIWAALPLAALMLVWFWLANGYSDGAADPLPYLPLLNPLEIGLLFALLGVGMWAMQAGAQLGYNGNRLRLAVQGVVGLSLFALASAMVFRSVHHWSGVPFQSAALLVSMQVQAGLSLVWTSIALGLMISGHRRGRREFWLSGAALIALVVTKLFFVELGNQGGLERIVSFIGVGVLLLVVGYFAPLPPRKPSSEDPADT